MKKERLSTPGLRLFLPLLLRVIVIRAIYPPEGIQFDLPASQICKPTLRLETVISSEIFRYKHGVKSTSVYQRRWRCHLRKGSNHEEVVQRFCWLHLSSFLFCFLSFFQRRTLLLTHPALEKWLREFAIQRRTQAFVCLRHLTWKIIQISENASIRFLWEIGDWSFCLLVVDGQCCNSF
mgnify:CR=1 FL=1